MRTPLWVLTSILFFVFLLVLLFMFFVRTHIPSRTSLKVQPVSGVPLKDVSKVNIARIYENDLFNTFIQPEVIKPVIDQVVPEVPRPPMPQPPPVAPISRPQFFAPLDITLKGVIYAYDDKENRAVISDNKSKNEQLYRIGDHLEDADIIHIGKNKVVFLRSNGQQETVFITPAAAQNDPIFAQDASWSSIVKQIEVDQYIIDPKAFVNRINSPAQLLDMLDLTTAFDRGISVGLRVGRMDQRSIGPALGLRLGDIITQVQGISTTSTKDRVEIFQQIKSLEIGSTISILFIRNGVEQKVSFTLQRIEKDNEVAPEVGTFTPVIPPTTELTPALSQEAFLQRQRLENLNKRQTSGSSMKIAKRQDRQAMLQHGGRNGLLQRMPQ